MTEKEFLVEFSRLKQEFLEKTPRSAGRPKGIRRKVLESFERWLELRAKTKKSAGTVPLGEFLDEVINVTGKLLEAHNIKISYPLPVFKESKRCIRVFENSSVFYRIGKVKPRKGLNKGQNLLVIELVMDGNKKTVFLPLLKMKEEIEKKLGDDLFRELPQTESTGRYRLKRFLPYSMVETCDVQGVSRALADFILATVPSLEKLGLSRNT